MTRLPFSVALAALVCAAGAKMAEAQVDNDPQGPVCVASDDTTSLYESTVTCDADFVFTLRVYHNGRIRHYTNTFVVNSGPTYDFTKTVYHTNWGMYSGDTLNYFGRATEWGTPNYDQDSWIITVSDAGGCRLDPAPPADMPTEIFHAIKGPRYNA